MFSMLLLLPPPLTMLAYFSSFAALGALTTHETKTCVVSRSLFLAHPCFMIGPYSRTIFTNPMKNSKCGHTIDISALNQLKQTRKMYCPIPGCTNRAGFSFDQYEEDTALKLKLESYHRRMNREKKKKDDEREEEDDEEHDGVEIL